MIIDTIVTDLDDTLLDGNDRISERTMRVIEVCKQRGIRVIPASGRSQASMMPYVVQMDTGLPYIGNSGAEIIGADHAMMQQLVLDPALAKEVCTCLQQNGFYVQVYRDDCSYHAAGRDEASRYRKASGLRGVEVPDLCAFIDFDTPKLLGVCAPEEVERLRPVISERFAGRVTFTGSKPYFIEALPVGANKGDAVRRLSAMWQKIVPERTVAFGDSLNDISLLDFTPNSVAMGNARAEVKRAAAYICPPNTEDGWAQFVEEHILRS